jgi:hypothetical protein
VIQIVATTSGQRDKSGEWEEVGDVLAVDLGSREVCEIFVGYFFKAREIEAREVREVGDGEAQVFFSNRQGGQERKVEGGRGQSLKRQRLEGGQAGHVIYKHVIFFCFTERGDRSHAVGDGKGGIPEFAFETVRVIFRDEAVGTPFPSFGDLPPRQEEFGPVEIEASSLFGKAKDETPNVIRKA